MNTIADEILEMIFEYLDDPSKWAAMRVSRRWRNIFGSHSKLLKYFNMELDSITLSESLENFPDAPIKNVSICYVKFFDNTKEFQCDGIQTEKLETKTAVLNLTDGESSDESYNSSDNSSSSSEGDLDFSKPLSTLISVLSFYQSSIENLKIVCVKFESTKSFLSALEPLLKLKDLEIQFCGVKIHDSDENLKLPQIKSVKFLRSSNFFLDAFLSFNQLEKIKITNAKWEVQGFSHSKLNTLLQSTPTLQNLILMGTGTASYFESPASSYQFKLRKLEAYLTTFDFNTKAPRIEFFKSQKGFLNEIHIDKLPYDYDGDAIMEYLIKEMNLDELTYSDYKLVKNGDKCDIDEIWFNEVQIKAGLELMRQFRCIKNLRLWLCETHIIERKARELLDPTSSLFSNLIELTILDHSGSAELFKCFKGLYKNCTNITFLHIETPDENLNSVLKECLPLMTQLKKLKISIETPSSRGEINEEILMERFEIIRRFCLELKWLSLDFEFLNQAKEFFSNEIELDEY